MTGFWDWLGRVIMLVLAGMITLSIIGAIAAIPSGSIPSKIVAERRPWPVPEASGQRPEQVPQAPTLEPAATQAPPRSPGPRTTIVPAAPKPIEPAQWLEAITYALFALIGLAALATLLLWRSLRQWRRSADALEALAARTRPP